MKPNERENTPGPLFNPPLGAGIFGILPLIERKNDERASRVRDGVSVAGRGTRTSVGLSKQLPHQLVVGTRSLEVVGW